MTDRMMIIIDVAGVLIAVAGWFTVRTAARNRTKQLAKRAIHPAE